MRIRHLLNLADQVPRFIGAKELTCFTDGGSM
jgi:hypothetical protein